LTFTEKSDILFAVMRVETQTHIRNQASKIENLVGMVGILAETNLVDKAHIQLRLGQLKQRLETSERSNKAKISNGWKIKRGWTHECRFRKRPDTRSA
jgi:hypothetical protein